MLLRKLYVLGLLTTGCWLASSCASGGGGYSCGNGVCESDFEDSVNCPTDCASGVCGNNICETGEDSFTCPVDCSGGTCGNAICDIGENAITCASDCSGGICGNAQCEASENTVTCPVDCVCGNSTCDTGESATTCPIDCGATTCGNGVCDGGETSASCPQDCSTTPVCGDGVCNGTETVSTCAQDCDVSCSDPVCDLYPQCGCVGGEKCSLVSSDRACISAGSTQPGGTCTADTDCAAGGYCIGRDTAGTVGQCLAYCEPTTQAGCSGTSSYCLELVDSSQITIPGAGICTITCQPHNPSAACPTNFGCEMYTHNITDVSFTDCHADVGSGTYLTACDSAVGPFCAVGYGCFNDGPPSHCYQWCTSGSACAGGLSCDTAAFDPPLSVGGTTYGVCR
jgi:hypothetical protein